MKTWNQRILFLSACGMAFSFATAPAARAQPVTCIAELQGAATFQLQNDSPLLPAQIAVTGSGEFIVSASPPGTGLATADVGLRDSFGNTLMYTHLESTGSAQSQPLPSGPFVYTIPPAGSIAFTSFGNGFHVDATATGTPSDMDAVARATSTGSASFTNNSQAPVTLTISSQGGSYNLSVAGSNPPIAVGRASVMLIGQPVTVQREISQGSETAPVVAALAVPIPPGQSFELGKFAQVEAQSLICTHPPSGDLTGDGQTDGSDIQPFVVAAFEHSTQSVDLCRADFNGNGVVDEGDVPTMVTILLAG